MTHESPPGMPSTRACRATDPARAGWKAWVSCHRCLVAWGIYALVAVAIVLLAAG